MPEAIMTIVDEKRDPAMRGVETLIALKNGAVVTQLSEKLRDLTAAVRSTEKTGSLTLKLKVSPAAKGSGDVVIVEATLKSLLPEPDMGRTVFFTTDEGDLLRQDPNQKRLFQE